MTSARTLRSHMSDEPMGLIRGEEIADEYVRGSEVEPYIVHLDGHPIGFIQSYVAAASGDGWTIRA
jgi:hypothetical protein